MTEKLTLSDCMKYPNAKIIKYDILNSGRTVIYDNIIRLIENYESGYHIIVHNCKLILRDITELTDEEKKHIDRVACINPIRYVIYESKEFDYAIMEDDLQICDYLRSINIDIDDYLLSGKAVKE